jgi:hypothetical protein
MSDEHCIECGHTKAQHVDPTNDNGDCETCFQENRDVICDRWRDEPKGAGYTDREGFCE